MYVRFVTGTDSQDCRWLTGIVTTSRELRDDGHLEPFEVEIIESTFDWFNEHLPCPPFSQNLAAGKWSADAVAWFLPEAKEAIQRMWDLVAILKQHGIPVRVVWTKNPGMTVYRDEFQVVAETPKRKEQSL